MNLTTSQKNHVRFLANQAASVMFAGRLGDGSIHPYARGAILGFRESAKQAAHFFNLQNNLLKTKINN